MYVFRKVVSHESFAESHWVDSVISALAKILLMSSFTTFISISICSFDFVKKNLFTKELTKQQLQIFFDYNGNKSWRGGVKKNFGKS